MKKAELHSDGNGQVICLPKEFQLSGTEAYVQKIGSTVILVPKDKAWEIFLDGINDFTDDYFDAVTSRNGDET